MPQSQEQSLEIIARELSSINRKMEACIASLSKSIKVLQNEEKTPTITIPQIGSSGPINDDLTSTK